MLTTEELLDLLKDLENDRVERTIATANTDKFAQAICAYANDLPNHQAPGYLIVGADDDGKPAGLTVTDQLLQNLAAIRSDGNIQPLPAISVGKYSLQNGEVAVVEVLPSDLPPVRYKGQVWIRVGPRRAIASEQEERILTERRAAVSKTFDGRPCVGSTLDDLALDLFVVNYRANAVAPEVIAENSRDIHYQLASLRFFDLAKDCPTYAGIILFGKDPLRWVSGAYLQFVRFQGTGMTDPVQTEKTLSGDLQSVLRELDSLLAVQFQERPVGDTALREKTVSDYPMVALRELLMNAVMHRSYESTAPVRFYWFRDHVEIQSPGGLYGEASPENFPRQNAYRNPVLAEAMKVLGYVNKFGRGVLRAQEALATNGNPAGEFSFDAGYVLATLRARP